MWHHEDRFGYIKFRKNIFKKFVNILKTFYFLQTDKSTKQSVKKYIFQFKRSLRICIFLEL